MKMQGQNQGLAEALVIIENAIREVEAGGAQCKANAAALVRQHLPTLPDSNEESINGMMGTAAMASALMIVGSVIYDFRSNGMVEGSAGMAKVFTERLNKFLSSVPEAPASD